MQSEKLILEMREHKKKFFTEWEIPKYDVNMQQILKNGKDALDLQKCMEKLLLSKKRNLYFISVLSFFITYNDFFFLNIEQQTKHLPILGSKMLYSQALSSPIPFDHGNIINYFNPSNFYNGKIFNFK